MNPMKSYLRNGLLITLLLLGAVAALNAVVDPYHVLGSSAHHGLFAVKPQAGAHGLVAKAHLLPRVLPRSLILGNSRAEVGFDPASPAWPAAVRPVFNAAQPGAGPEVALAYLRHALGRAADAGVAKPGLILLGVDFIDFMPERIAAKLPPRTGTHPSASAPPTPADNDLRKRKDYVEALLTTSALMDSIVTLNQQGRPDAADLTALGFNPMHDYQSIARQEGYWRLFAQKNGTYTQMLAGRRTDGGGAGRARALAFHALDELLSLARREGIEVRVVLYPYHAEFLELIHRAGLWPAWEAWKRDLVQHVEASTRVSDPAGLPSVPIFDFSGVNPWTAEAVPAAGDRSSSMRWYWESGHFKQTLGAQVLDAVLAAPMHTAPSAVISAETLPFTLLTQDNLAASQDALQAAMTERLARIGGAATP